LAAFTVYQALPDSVVPSRNNELVYEKIGYIFFANMLINALWLIFFGTATIWGFSLGLIDIIAMLLTNLYIMKLSTTNSVNIWEGIGLRAGFSLYAGWVTAATVLNFVFLFKRCGMKDINNPF